MYTISGICDQMFPIVRGSQLIRGKSWTKCSVQWGILLWAQIQALVPVLAALVIVYMTLLGRSLSSYEFWVLAASCFEVEFYMYCWVLHRRLGAKGVGKPRTQEERRWLMQRVLEHPEGLSSMLARWFLPLGKKVVSRARLEAFFAWSLFDTNTKDMSPAELRQLNELLYTATEKVPGLIGCDSAEAKGCMSMNHDPLVVQHKPLATYLVIWGLQATGHFLLFAMGFRRFSVGRIKYWLYMPKRIGTDPPVLFIHGIGIGLVMYSQMARELILKKPNRPVLLLELPYVSVALSGQIPSMDQTLTAIDSILKRHSFQQCTFMAHSYGTLVAAWVAKLRPHLVARLVLVDPVCFLVWEPSLIYNFLYAKPDSFTQFMCQFFISNDMYVSYTLRRHFWWCQNNLFPEFLRSFKTQVFLAERDYIIDAPFMNDYLKRATDPKFVDVCLFQKITHGAYLNSKKHMDTIISHV